MSELAGPNNIVACRLWLISDPISRSLLSTLTVIDSAKLIGLHCSRCPFGKIIYHFKTVAYAFRLNSFRWNFRRFDLDFWQKLYFWSDLRGVVKNYRDRFYFSKSTKLRNLRLSLLGNNSTPLQHISSCASTTLEIIFGQRLSSFVAFCLITFALWNYLTCSQFLISEIKKSLRRLYLKMWRLLRLSNIVIGQKRLNRNRLVSRNFLPSCGDFLNKFGWNSSYPQIPNSQTYMVEHLQS